MEMLTYFIACWSLGVTIFQVYYIVQSNIRKIRFNQRREFYLDIAENKTNINHMKYLFIDTRKGNITKINFFRGSSKKLNKSLKKEKEMNMFLTSLFIEGKDIELLEYIKNNQNSQDHFGVEHDHKIK